MFHLFTFHERFIKASCLYLWCLYIFSFYFWAYNTTFLPTIILTFILISTDITPSQGNFSLPQIETITEKHNYSECRIMEPSSNGYIYKTVLHVRLKEHCQRSYKDCKSQRIMKFSVGFCLLAISESITIQSQQHYWQNMRWIRTAIDMPNWMG